MGKRSKSRKPESGKNSFLKNSESEPSSIHTSVLLAETLEFLQPENGGLYVDATLGMGGHSEALLESSSRVKVIGIDQDTEAIAIAEKRLDKFGERFKAIHSNFSQIGKIIEREKIEKIDGILADLGVSSLQLDSEERGFSFRFDAPLDMRMNADSSGETVAELIENVSEFELARIIYEYGEERFSRRIARRIIEKRENGESPKTTKELADLVYKVVSRSGKDKIHPATRTFQALRIAINSELENLEKFLSAAVDKLSANKCLAIISFHSLEDRIVKRFFQKMSGKCECPPNFPICICGAEKRVKILTRKPIVPQDFEVLENPRARSAKLRVCQKLD